MKSLHIFTSIVFILTLTSSLSYCLEEYSQYTASDDKVSKLVRVKRKGGKGGGGRRGGSSRSKSAGRAKTSDPYPKQPAYNPNYNPGTGGAYPKQPGMNTGQQYPGSHNYPNTGQHNPGGSNYPGQTGYNQPNYGKTGGLGGIGMGNTGIGGTGFGKSKSGIGSALGVGAAGGVLGAAVGAYGGYKLGQMVGKMGRGGHYGYYDDDYRHVRCDPPPRIETDPETNITYIPKTVTYDARCHYYDKQPPNYYPGYENYRRPYLNSIPTIEGSGLNIMLTMIAVFVICFFDSELSLFRFNTKFWSKI